MLDNLQRRIKRLPSIAKCGLLLLSGMIVLIVLECGREEWEERAAMRKQPLIWAVYTGDLPAAQHLLKAGASATVSVEDPNWEDVPRSVLLIACDRDNVRMARLLLQHGAARDLDSADGWFNTPVCTAIQHGNTAMLKLLLQQGASPNTCDGLGPEAKSALMLAKEAHNTSAITLLHQYGAME